MLFKEQVFDTIKTSGERIFLDELIDRLIFIEKVNIGMEQSKQGIVNSEEETIKKLSKWLQ